MTFPASLMKVTSAGPGMSTIPPYGLAMRFSVKVADLGDLGKWSSCEGLKVDLKVKRVVEGGNYSYEHILPDKISYSDITLKRAVEPNDSEKVQAWLRKVASDWMNSARPYPAQTAVITLQGATGQTVMTWTLRKVYPVSWSGPALTAEKSNVAIETLVLAHQGFLSS
jgi:phage tail-like protein